jgi:RTX calcium-binding nonapeptide repeat (4 copies)
MKRILVLLVTMAAAVVVASGVALAAAIAGTNGDDTLIGTNNRDTISGAAGDDFIAGRDARDSLYGDQGADEVHGNAGNDQVFTGQGADEAYAGRGDNDFVNTLDEELESVIDCGPGQNDEAYVDFDESELAVAGGCEIVHGAGVEPLQAEGVTSPETLTPETTPEGVSIEQVSP